MLLVLLALFTAAASAQPGADLLPVTAAESSTAPLNAIGQLTNGCTGYLIGPCHVMTVAHCVHEPWRGIWWQGLDFHPGRNLAGGNNTNLSPLGSASKADVRLHPNWTSTAAGPASDAAMIITSTPIGRKVGWFRHKPPAHITQKQQVQVQSAEGLRQLVAAEQLTLHIAGYPDNRANGSMWQQCCSALDWQLQGDKLWHDCYARGGNSGSPVWVVWPDEQQQGTRNSSSTAAAASWDRFSAVGVHSASLKVPADSQVGLYAAEQYAQGVARAQQRKAAGGQTCSAATASLQDLSGAGHVGMQPAVAAGRVATGRKLLAGAGGREEEEGVVLLPVAVPFVGDTYAWVEQVLTEFERCPGE